MLLFGEHSYLLLLFMKLGLILPTSKSFPYLGKDLRNGFNLGLEHCSISIDVLLNSISLGKPAEYSTALNEVVVEENADMVIVFGDTNVVPEIKEFVENTNIPVILTGSGARLPIFHEDKLENLFYHSAQLWESAYYAGKVLTEKMGKRVAVLSSFFESGYPFVYAFTEGVQSSGGEVVYFGVVQQNHSKREIDDKHNEIKALKPDFVFLCSHGKQASELSDLFQNSNCEAYTFFGLNHLAQKSQSENFYSWHLKLKNDEQIKFVSSYREEFKKDPTIFSLLGYELALIISIAFHPDSQLTDHKKRLEKLTTAFSVLSSRGELCFNANLNAFTAPLYYQSAKKESDKMYFELLPYPTELIEKEVALNKLGNRSGWTNTYPCK